jgi:type III secretion protein T
MFLAEFALAMVSRFAPQVQVFVLAMPIKSMLAIFMLIFYASVMFPYSDEPVPVAFGFAARFYTLLHIPHGPDVTIHATPYGALRQ